MNEETRKIEKSVAANGGRRVGLAGATGLVGQALLDGLLADESVSSVFAFGRREPPVKHRKLTALTVDFTALPAVEPLDEIYLALGTTIKTAGSRAAFRAVDFDANLAVARAARAAGAARCALVSAMGADAGSKIFYNRVKGELEDALALLGFEALVIARPSLLLGNREKLGQASRPLESVSMSIGSLLSPLIPRNYRPIAAANVARMLLARAPSAKGRVVLLSGEML